MAQFEEKGWCRFEFDPNLAEWLAGAEGAARKVSLDAEMRAKWLRHQGTWFVGADVLGNDQKGSIDASGALRGQAIDYCQSLVGNIEDWGPGQVSVCYPGYPKQDANESDGNHRYRVKRDAAHLDGLKAESASRRRYMEEYHKFILGIPVNNTAKDAAPFVVWEGSHLVFHNMLQQALAKYDPSDWPKVDLTDTYQKTRAEIFDTCARVVVHARPGEAYLTHRFALHGVAPWGQAVEQERSVIYFRPFWTEDRRDWLTL